MLWVSFFSSVCAHLCGGASYHWGRSLASRPDTASATSSHTVGPQITSLSIAFFIGVWQGDSSLYFTAGSNPNCRAPTKVGNTKCLLCSDYSLGKSWFFKIIMFPPYFIQILIHPLALSPHYLLSISWATAPKMAHGNWSLLGTWGLPGVVWWDWKIAGTSFSFCLLVCLSGSFFLILSHLRIVVYFDGNSRQRTSFFMFLSTLLLCSYIIVNVV